MGKHILIIGLGYVGSALARKLVGEGFDVTSLNRTAPEPTGFPVLGGDVSDESSIRSVRREMTTPPDAIVHCASSGRGGAEAYRAVFLDGIRNLRSHFPEAPVFFTSSTSVYGQTDGSVVTEESPTEPDRETSRILIEAEELAREGKGTALRLAGIYGPARSIYLRRILDGTAEIESGEVSRFLNQVHRDDVVGALLHLLRSDPETAAGRVFNVVDDTPLTQRACYEGLAGYFALPVPPEAPPDTTRKRAWTNKVVANRALRSTGWEPIYPSFLEALRDDPTLVPSIRAQITSDET